MRTNRERIEQLEQQKCLSAEDWGALIKTHTEEDRAFAATRARQIALREFGRGIYFRGIVEYTNRCKNNCIYCGIRRDNREVCRYRLSQEEILSCCREGYELGFRTFVLQGGEDPHDTDETMTQIVSAIRGEFADCAITLSIGERSRESYQKLFDAGADRYLLRHETADEAHYHKLHPPELSWKNRMRCLFDLKEIGFQTGCGFMVGSPYQTTECLVKDMLFIAAFQPEMIGIGPFLPHKDTPFAGFAPGSAEDTLFFLSLCRILLPKVLLPATTALGTVRGDGRKLGVLAGANVIMPNLSPLAVRKKYMLYDNKAGTSDDAQEGIRRLKEQMHEIGYEIVVGRGDFGGSKHD